MTNVRKKRAETCVVAIIRDETGKVLLTKRERPPKVGMWHLPGGSVEFGEGHLVALARELLEETGVQIVVSDKRPLAASSTLYPDVDRHVVAIYFAADIVAGVPKPLDGTTDVRWCDENEAHALLDKGVMLDSCRRALCDALGWHLPSRD